MHIGGILVDSSDKLSSCLASLQDDSKMNEISNLKNEKNKRIHNFYHTKSILINHWQINL